MNDFKSLIISAIPSSPAVYAAFSAPSGWTIFTSIVLPIALFILSKTVDVLVQIYFKRQG
jgi:hypothetical protein